jgi:hypothetical protein
VVSQCDEVVDDGVHSARRVHQRRGHAGQAPVQQHQRRRPGHLVDLRVLQARRAQHDAVHLLRHRVHELRLGDRVLVAVRHEHRVVGLHRPRLHGLEHAREERVVEVRHDDADVARLARDEPAGRPVGLVAELGRGSQHA